MGDERAEQLFEIFARECSRGLPWITEFPTKEDRENYCIRTYGATLDELQEVGIDPFM